MNDFAKTIQRQLAFIGRNRKWLASEARVGASTLDKIMSGDRAPSFEIQCKLERALGLELGTSMPSPTAVASESFGGYSRMSMGWLEGNYVALRPSFDVEGAVQAAAVELRWDDAEPAMRFLQSDDFGREIVRRGWVSVSIRHGHVYLLRQDSGAHELTVLRLPAEQGRLGGLHTALVAQAFGQQAVSCPLVLVPADPRADPPPVCGLVRPGESAYLPYRRLLDAVELSGHARLAGIQGDEWRNVTDSSRAAVRQWSERAP